MFACVDVHYENESAQAACVLFHSWDDAVSAVEIVEPIAHVEPYEPGQFFRRELPCLLAVLGRVTTPLETVVIDGYVWLHDEDKPGLGAHLYEALGKRTPIIGVAKTQFAGARLAGAVVRGTSQRPLFVTAVGLELGTACRYIQRMHGAFRLPTLLKRVDQLSRQRAGAVEPFDIREGQGGFKIGQK